jgi:YD repeat-containing protein
MPATSAGTPASAKLYRDYTYDAVGNIATILDHSNGNQTETFSYDALDRLVSGATSGGAAAPIMRRTLIMRWAI